MKSCLLKIISCFLFLAAGNTGLDAATYYIDPGGDDKNPGTHENGAWRSLARVNRHTFFPGDRILLKAGGSWSGQLNPRGSGKKGDPILIGSYGEGARPIINGGGQLEGAIKLLNQQYWEVRGLEVTNRAKTRGEHVGIKVRNSTGGPLNHVRISDCVVHDVNGWASGFYGANAGISVVADMNNSTWNDIVIEDNQVYSTDRAGIFVGPSWQLGTSRDWIYEPKTRNVVIQNNVLWDLGGDGIINFVTDQVLVQYNVVHTSGRRNYDEAVGPGNPTGYLGGASAGIWNVISDNTIIQFNEVFNFINPKDGQGFDIDMGTNHTVLQYNYSHDNDGGFILFAESGGPADINDAKVRFNISQNDGTTRGVIHIGGHGLPPGPEKLQFHNNTIYVPAWAKPGVRLFVEYKPRGISDEAHVHNNIFYLMGTVSYPDSFSGMVFDSNVFYGHNAPNEPADANKSIADPLLVAPGSAGLGIDTVDGYRLRAGSPALGSGKALDQEVLGSRDYWGNPVTAGAPLNRGAYNGPAVAGFPANYAFGRPVTASSCHNAEGWSASRLVDGVGSSLFLSKGFSSAPGIPADHDEWIVIDLQETRNIGTVTLYPCDQEGSEGRGFPAGFEIQIWNGKDWRTVLPQTNYPRPKTGPQTFKLDERHSTAMIRLYCTALDKIGTDYILRLAEIEISE